MLDRIFLAALFNLSLMFSIAMAGNCCSSGCDDGCVTCPSCRNVCCQLKAEPSEEEKHCWQVECKDICVPRVVFPWQNCQRGHHAHGGVGCDSCCADGCCSVNCCDACRCNNGACVITVKVLKKHTYTCPSCKYSWTPVASCCNGGACCDPGCAAAPTMMDDQQPEPAVAPPSDVPPAPPEPAADQAQSASSVNQLYKQRIRAIFSSRTKLLRDKP